MHSFRQHTIHLLMPVAVALALSACGGGGGSSNASAKFTAVSVTEGSNPKQVDLNWDFTGTADHFAIEVNPDGKSGFTAADRNGDGKADAADNIAGSASSVTVTLALHLADLDGALYRLVAYDAAGNKLNASTSLSLLQVTVKNLIGYVKASNTEKYDDFGHSLALSADGKTLAVGAKTEDSNATGINGDETNDAALASGAVYVLTRGNDGSWKQQAYVKASNAEAQDRFGHSLALSANGDTLVVGATNESSDATGINNDETNNDADSSGAVYVFTRDDSDVWTQQAYVKASNTDSLAYFGRSLALSSDGDTLAVGADGESSKGATNSGAAYVFTRDNSDVWTQQAYIKGSNTKHQDHFGSSLALSAYGNTLAVGARSKSSGDTNSGSAYVFTRDKSNNWSQQAYVTASNAGKKDYFGSSLALAADGDTLAVGAYGESSDATGIDGDQTNNNAEKAGAVYVFTRDKSDAWSQQAYVKASNTEERDNFGTSIALSADGNILAVGAAEEDSNATGIAGDQINNDAKRAGAVYVFTRDGVSWSQRSYVKASNTGANDQFGHDVTLSNNGNTLAVGAFQESSDAKGVDGDQDNNKAEYAGAVYLY